MSSRVPHDSDGWAKRYSSPRSVPLAPYNVILHRDAEKSLLFIARAVMELTRFCKEEAMIRMWEAYLLGRAVVIATHLERAELYVEQFAERGLAASVEPAY
jgi:ATP-dependent Clp protease adaptor protein ClpS